MKNKYYVYILINPIDNTPFYVGKGKGARYKHHEKEIDKHFEYFSLRNNQPEKLLSLKLKVLYDLREMNHSPKVDLIENLSELDSYLLEQCFIAWFGRRLCGNGVLANVLSGGKEGKLLFDEQILIEIYKRPKLLEIVLQYPKLSTNWIAKSLYFYNENERGYPFTELGIDWLNIKINFEQYAERVINKLKEYDALITPFYWVRKVNDSDIKTDATHIFEEGQEFIRGTYLEKNLSKKMNFYIQAYGEIVDKL